MVSVAKPACVIPRNALNDTRDSETKLKASQEVCNETMMALWDECKPCRQQTCVKFYARVCSSSSGLAGHRLEDFLNQSSPFYFWINGDRIDSLMENDWQQSHVMDIMEDSFNRAPNTMDELFQHRFFPQRPQDTQYYSPFSSFPRGSLFFNPKSRFAWNLPFPVLEPLNFHDVFQPFYNMIHQAQQAVDAHLHRTPYHFPMVEFAGENNDRTMCKEISYNSTRCLWMKGQCAKCQEILEVVNTRWKDSAQSSSALGTGCVTRLPFVFIPVELSLHISVICLCSFHLWEDCSANIPTQTLLCQQLNESLQLVEKFSRLCDQLLQSFQQKMLDTSALLKQLIEQFTWVSQLAHLMQNNDQYHLQVSTEANTQVQRCTETSLPDEAECHDPILWVVVKLFNPFPITVMVLQEVPSPNFMENVVEKALQQYCQKNLEE
ncbi:hypothetical protein MG293_007741 [Ovis ammon polii]|uniref:Clusterin n=1 Tax=Ovis ammon polii TaxID=230172 RepID=A0AAD4UD06_OVIAM|nr:hypothetical protein MG293_007741 [Ovis ammon polii]